MGNNLFVIEGTDGSGKSTQLALACRWMEQQGIEYRRVVFPRYENQSSALVRMYLEGRFGSQPSDVSAYAASTFFAVDRFASFRTEWGEEYARGVPILADRYTTSNAIHQAAKLPEEELQPFLDWLFDFEYRILGLPAPTAVLFMDMPTEQSLKLLKKRQGENGDIHERDHGYLLHCRERALRVCEAYHWIKVSCMSDGLLRAPTDISADVCQILRKQLEAK